MRRLNLQICRHSPGSRFITLFYAVYSPATGALTYVNAGQHPPLLRRVDGTSSGSHGTGIALGMFEGSTYERRRNACSATGETLVLYSDGITEAEDPAGSAVRGERARSSDRHLLGVLPRRRSGPKCSRRSSATPRIRGSPTT